MRVMGVKMKRNKTTSAELPEEVIRNEILTRLPIKDVVRFKCVSKSWLSLFSDPQFIQDHFTRCSTQNPNDYDCLVAQKHKKIVILSRYKETFVLPCTYFSLLGSIRGLVCLRSTHKLSLWNPAIHQSKEFSLPTRRSRDYMCDIGFGFDSVSNEYKVVVLSGDLRFANVYYPSSDSWIDVSVRDLGSLKNRRAKHYVIVNDCPYWIISKYMRYKHPYHKQLILGSSAVCFIAFKFDARTNEFKLLPELKYDMSARRENYIFGYEFVDMNDRLTFMMPDRKSSNCMVNISSLTEEEGSCVWSKMYVIGPIDFHTRSSYVSLSQGFKYGSEIVYHDDGMFSCYDHKTDTKKCFVSTTTSTTPSVVKCFRYTPNLVFLEGMKSVYLPTQTRRAPGLSYRTPRRLNNSLRS